MSLIYFHFLHLVIIIAPAKGDREVKRERAAYKNVEGIEKEGEARQPKNVKTHLGQSLYREPGMWEVGKRLIFVQHKT